MHTWAPCQPGLLLKQQREAYQERDVEHLVDPPLPPMVLPMPAGTMPRGDAYWDGETCRDQTWSKRMKLRLRLQAARCEISEWLLDDRNEKSEWWGGKDGTWNRGKMSQSSRFGSHGHSRFLGVSQSLPALSVSSHLLISDNVVGLMFWQNTCLENWTLYGFSCFE